jgi:nitric oxide reductase NorD protein
MEETIGLWWHHAVTRLSQRNHPQAEVKLQDVQKTIGILFRAAGGSAALRLAAAAEQPVGGRRNWLQVIAGSGRRASIAVLEPDVLALPETLAVFDSAELNRDLYMWLAIQGACYEHTERWLFDSCAATRKGLEQFPGFLLRYKRLLQAHLSQRAPPAQLKGASAMAEGFIQAALRDSLVADGEISPADVAPVWLWVSTGTALPTVNERTTGSKSEAVQNPGNETADGKRRRTQSIVEDDNRNAFILPFRGEALMSWSELVHVNRSTDDEDDGNAVAAANDMDKLSVAPDGESLASRVKFDLDLPSASADDRPLDPGVQLPEWDYRNGVMRPNYCAVQAMEVRDAPAYVPAASLRLTAQRLRRRLEVLRDVPRPQHGQSSGDAIDIDAWIRFTTDETGNGGLRSEAPAVYTRQAKCERSLATLLLADLSLSTDAYANDTERVIDIIRDALFVFGEALSATGDPFAIWGFSSVRRHHVRLQHLKNFSEPWADAARARVGAIKPGFYTRMGAAIRHATLQLSERPERRRLLMLLTDGKPNDLDEYEGRYGIEDTRHAIHEAQAAGLSPFCVTIDETAHDYLPYLFGREGYALVHRPHQLVNRLTQAWANLAR